MQHFFDSLEPAFPHQISLGQTNIITRIYEIIFSKYTHLFIPQSNSTASVSEPGACGANATSGCVRLYLGAGAGCVMPLTSM